MAKDTEEEGLTRSLSLVSPLHGHRPPTKKPHPVSGLSMYGRGGIRTPGWFPISCFQDRRIRPLCHSSVSEER